MRQNHGDTTPPTPPHNYAKTKAGSAYHPPTNLMPPPPSWSPSRIGTAKLPSAPHKALTSTPHTPADYETEAMTLKSK